MRCIILVFLYEISHHRRSKTDTEAYTSFSLLILGSSHENALASFFFIEHIYQSARVPNSHDSASLTRHHNRFSISYLQILGNRMGWGYGYGDDFWNTQQRLALGGFFELGCAVLFCPMHTSLLQILLLSKGRRSFCLLI